jgi:ankyrin repeat protein
MIPILLQAGADVNKQSNEHRTALHEAVSENHGDVVRLLLGAKARTDLRDSGKRTAVDLASGELLGALQGWCVHMLMLILGTCVPARICAVLCCVVCCICTSASVRV